MKSKVYYSVQNGGDGSAHPIFFEDELCAELHQELMPEGWGESCVGELEVESESPAKFLDITTRVAYIKELQEILDDNNDYYNLGATKRAIERLSK